MSESQLSVHVRSALVLLHLRGYHTYNSRRSEPGFPDWVIVGQHLMFRELKTERGRLSAAQIAWLDDLKAAGQDAGIWRPSDWLSGRILSELKDTRGI